jgi:hypothetical protein
MSFKSDLEFGNKFEKEFVKVMKYPNYRIMGGNFKDYDIEVNEEDKIVKYECKADRHTNKTGNICIEFMCSNKHSGISTTKSDYYAYFEVVDKDKYILYIIPTDIIRESITKKEYIKIMKGGNVFRAEFYLFKKEKFEKYKINLD